MCSRVVDVWWVCSSVRRFCVWWVCSCVRRFCVRWVCSCVRRCCVAVWRMGGCAVALYREWAAVCGRAMAVCVCVIHRVEWGFNVAWLPLMCERPYSGFAECAWCARECQHFLFARSVP